MNCVFKIEDNVAFSLLTKRQQQILYHTLFGKSAKDIAKILGLSHRTIQHHLETIKTKLNVNSKSELIEKTMLDVAKIDDINNIPAKIA